MVKHVIGPFLHCISIILHTILSSLLCTFSLCLSCLPCLLHLLNLYLLLKTSSEVPLHQILQHPNTVGSLLTASQVGTPCDKGAYLVHLIPQCFTLICLRALMPNTCSTKAHMPQCLHKNTRALLNPTCEVLKNSVFNS